MKYVLFFFLMSSQLAVAASFCSGRWASSSGRTLLGPLVAQGEGAHAHQLRHDAYLKVEPHSAEARNPGISLLFRELALNADFARSGQVEPFDFLDGVLFSLNALDASRDPRTRQITRDLVERLSRITERWSQFKRNDPGFEEWAVAFQTALWDAVVALQLNGKKILMGATAEQIFGRGGNHKIHVAVQRADDSWVLIEMKNWPTYWYKQPKHMERAVTQSLEIQKLRDRGLRFEYWLVMTADLPEAREQLLRMGARYDQTWIVGGPSSSSPSRSPF